MKSLEETKGTFTDPRDSKVYKTVEIGEQTWLAENLNYEAEGSVCYENNPANCAKYGRLYNWETAKTVCPKGWHLPSNAEWDKLFCFVDGDKGTNKYGFSSLPGGNGYSDGSFRNVGNGYWWSTTEFGASYDYLRYIYYYYSNGYRDGGLESNLYSVRCLQD